MKKLNNIYQSILFIPFQSIFTDFLVWFQLCLPSWLVSFLQHSVHLLCFRRLIRSLTQQTPVIILIICISSWTASHNLNTFFSFLFLFIFSILLLNFLAFILLSIFMIGPILFLFVSPFNKLTKSQILIELLDNFGKMIDRLNGFNFEVNQIHGHTFQSLIKFSFKGFVHFSPFSYFLNDLLSYIQ